MLYAVVERSPRFHGKVKSFDDTRREKNTRSKACDQSAEAVFATRAEGVAVVADTSLGSHARDEKH